MRKLLVAGLGIALLATSAAQAILFGGEYQGRVKGDPDSSIMFDVNRSNSGHRRVVNFFATGMDFTCDSANPGQTAPVSLNRGFRVRRDRTFGGRADATIGGFDPPARLKGKLRRNGRAFGVLRVHGELDPVGQPNENCDTGRQEWRAERIPNPPSP